MRYKLLFTDVSEIVPIDSEDVDLPDNIVFAAGDTRADRRNDAARILTDRPEVNAVIMLEPQRLDLTDGIKQLDDYTKGRRFRTGHSLTDETKGFDPTGSLRSYLRNRALSDKNPLLEGIDPNELNAAARLWRESCAEADNVENTYFRNSIMTYVPEYSGHRSRPGAHINTHIDSMKTESDMRIVECLAGSGTVVFDDDDFAIFANEGVDLKQSGITCWSLIEGSSLAIRIPSQRTELMGARPTVHAHGLGREDDVPEQRLTVRHDFIFE